MQRMMLVVVLVGVLMSATLPYAGAIRCYSCEGYFSELPTGDYNNKYCPKGNFDKDKVSYTSGNSMCMYMLQELDGTEVTVRAGDRDTLKMFEKFKKSEKSSKPQINFSGYTCFSDLCNINTAPNTRSLSLPLLLLPVLASLLRCFA